ncbi:PREDICTED: transcription factor bHLH96-like [Ipomoea nil]|uniref:transcription factor bHLH96-like n=1 Tax=Ipomoea nil TaxID=35883 RepID=UPI000900D1A6|nr:PREDICTED: transcription factor bHLH96-like [Ipomoea nil]
MELEAMALYKVPQVSWSGCDFVANNNQFPLEFQCPNFPEFEACSYYPPPHHHHQWLPNSPPADHVVVAEEEDEVAGPTRQLHRRSNAQTNRRQQINDNLSYLHSLLPESYIQKGDEASILGGAINYVKELEEELQLLCAKNSTANLLQDANIGASDGCRGYELSTPCGDHIQVTMGGENHNNVELKLHSKWRPKLLPRFISQIETLMLTVLHFNLSRTDQFLLCSLSLKVEDGSKFTSVKRIATVANRILARIQEEDERV